MKAAKMIPRREFALFSINLATLWSSLSELSTFLCLCHSHTLSPLSCCWHTLSLPNVIWPRVRNQILLIDTAPLHKHNNLMFLSYPTVAGVVVIVCSSHYFFPYPQFFLISRLF